MIRMLVRSVLAALAVAAVAAVAGTTAPISEAAQPERCPAVVLLVARGNDSSGEGIEPRRYGGPGGRESNGYESRRIGDFLESAEQRHRRYHGGASLLAQVQVLGLTPEYYPAEIPVPEVNADSDLMALASSAGVLTRDVTAAVERMVQVGSAGARAGIEAYEAVSGCAPAYLLFGYSLGALVLAPQEGWLAERGQLAGAVYAASAYHLAASARVLGDPVGQRGILAGIAPGAHTANRISYCLRDDLVCDPSPRAVGRALSEDEGGPHARYFRDLDDPDLGLLVDALGDWVARAGQG